MHSCKILEVANDKTILPRNHLTQSFSSVASLLHLRVIFACLPDFYLFKLADFEAMASRYLTENFKRPALQPA